VLFRSAALATAASYEEHMGDLAFSKALEAVWDLLAKTNKYLNDSSPWSLTEDLSQRPRLATILHTSAEVMRIATILLAPVLPESCKLVWKQLGFQTSLKSQRLSDLKWGGLPVGGPLGEITPVFPRLDKKTVLDKIARIEEGDATVQPGEGPPQPSVADGKSAAPGTTPQISIRTGENAGIRTSTGPGEDKISIDDFARVDLRVAQVISAEKVKGADKLLKLVVDLGTESRQILAGIAKAYSPESLIGRKIIIVANLEPRKLRGYESNGMLLAASVGDEGQPVLAGFLEDVPNGAKLK
jgi:methionyl-tRNA synthetase